MELSGKRILVTGITGTLGLRVAKRLLPEALEVRGLIRQTERFTEFESLGITPAIGDLTDQTSLRQAMEQIDWVVHCAARGLDVRILRPGAICAEQDSHWGDRQVRRMQEADCVTWVHPDDLVNWVHADNIAEMVFLVLTRGKPGDVFHAVDTNIPETDFRMRLVEASGKPYQIPDRVAERPTYATDKIKTLGYEPVRSFDETIERLLQLFSLQPNAK
ncbi:MULTISPECIES: NAD-dependent epimerase/dehydratase family protein [Exiguobacterium]|uniref:NAD-dependent epimerase/dehydratase family protein n=1 Tax=Exiguobacterium TaxID=33986 RepID=UPI001BE96B5E|nr:MULTISPECIES: NAD-dependent epimerase/dehydratase family protein [Exiguobacterium]MCT4791487.1 NAD-dependent epimerase/dehydratase family protein [Exiguobacterium artemiae]